MTVNCLADGVQVDVRIDKTEPYVSQADFNGLLYVKGYSKDPNCRKSVLDVERGVPVDFKVKFGTCGLEHKDVSFLNNYYSNVYPVCKSIYK
jgi:hypothetical protein